MAGAPCVGVFLLLGGMIQTGDERGGEERERRLLTQPTKRDARCIIKRRDTRSCTQLRSSTQKWGSYLRQSAKRMHIDSRRFCRPDFAWGAHVYARVNVRYRIGHRAGNWFLLFIAASLKCTYVNRRREFPWAFRLIISGNDNQLERLLSADSE